MGATKGGAVDVDACSRCQRRPCTCPREFENFVLGEGWNRERLFGEQCMHVDDEGSFDCDRELDFFRGADEGACEEHAEAMGAIVRKAAPIAAAAPRCKTCGCTGGNGSWLTTWNDGSLRSTEACPICHDCTGRCFQCVLGGRLAANKCSVAEAHKHGDCVCLEHCPATPEPRP